MLKNLDSVGSGRPRFNYDDEEMGTTSLKSLRKVVKRWATKWVTEYGFSTAIMNLATILLRNGFLLAMKINLMNVGGKATLRLPPMPRQRKRNQS